MVDIRRNASDQQHTEQQLRREAQALLTELHMKLEQLDQVRQGQHRRKLTPEQRRARFRVIRGGAAVVGAALVWGWDVARRPVLAGAIGAAGIVAVPVALDSPLPPAQSALPPVVDWGGEQRPPEPAREEEPARNTYVEVPVEPSEPLPQPEPTVVVQMPDPEPPPVTVTPDPDPEPDPDPDPEPDPEPEPEPTVDVDLDPLEVCAELGLPPAIGLDLCLEELDRLDIDLDALGLDLDLDLRLPGL